MGFNFYNAYTPGLLNPEEDENAVLIVFQYACGEFHSKWLPWCRCLHVGVFREFEEMVCLQ